MVGMRTDLSDDERAWLGGVLSTQGTFKNGAIFRSLKAGRTVSMRWELASAKPALIKRVSELMGVEPRAVVRNKREIMVVSVFGEELQALMKAVWPWLLSYRQHQYARVKQASDESVLKPDDY